MGKAAVHYAVQGENSVMPTIVRVSNSPYRWEVGKVELEKIANSEKKMPLDFITEDGFGITPACREYLQPLIEGENYPHYYRGLPSYVILKNLSVRKKLDENFNL